tara:strand:+ start:506 stop:1249 length:744 start_codon:yes stop_codon:yes gene_type:complete
MDSKFSLPTEVVELPSKGLLYPEDSPLSKGTIEMKYMTAKEEDILTNRNYIKNGTVIDRLLKSLIVSEGVDYNELLIGDKNAIMVAARVLSYGKDYSVKYNGETVTVDLSKVKNKDIDYTVLEKRKNEFPFKLPHTDNTITFKLLTQADEISIEREINGLKKIKKDSSPEVTTRLKYMITSVNGLTEIKDIRDFVDNFLLAKDARALRVEYARVQPDLDLTFTYTDEDGGEEDVDIPINIGFFWPDA